jgi:chromosome segregation ATPase
MFSRELGRRLSASMLTRRPWPCRLRTFFNSAQSPWPILTTIDTLRAKLAELEKTHQELVTSAKDLASARDNSTKERDQARLERDALKKTASDRALRIAELKAQVADQAERQKQIDEEMAKAEGQLDMLKDLLRVPRRFSK